MISDDEDEGVTGEVDDMVVPKPKKDKSKDEGDSDDEGPRKYVLQLRTLWICSPISDHIKFVSVLSIFINFPMNKPYATK